MSNKVKTSEIAQSPKQILFMTQPYAAVGVVVSAASGTVDSSTGRKIVKAGTPLAGDLTDRTKAFTAVSSSSKSGISTLEDTPEDTPATSTTTSVVQGVLVHDVDVTDGDENGTLCIFGFIDLNKLEKDVVTLAESAATSLDGKVWFLRG